jgi:tetratricopeptide (TPR) repeat protein
MTTPLLSTHSGARCMIPTGMRKKPHGGRRTACRAALAAVLAGCCAGFLRADAIHLKNGNTIEGRVLREDSRSVYYEQNGNEIAIPRDLVKRIERSSPGADDAASVPQQSSPPKTREVPIPFPEAQVIPADSEVVKDGAINNAYLSQLDQLVTEDPTRDNQHRLTQAYQQAGIFLTQAGRPEAAIEEYRHALSLAPNDLALALALGYSLIKQGHFWEAIEVLAPAQDQNPGSPDIPLLIGSAYYGMEDLDRAIAEWKKALEIHDDPHVREALLRAEEERRLAGSYQELRSQHFILRYGGSEPREFVNQVLNTLENAFLDIENDLDFYPQEPIVVLLYPNQTFRDITRTPGWVGAINDGKIRIPVSGLSTVTPDFARVLRHELTHSFVYQITMGRCPVWFNEGIAQLEEGATTATLGSRLSRAFASLPPYSALEGSFMSLPAGSVKMVYAKSLAALEYLRDTYGMSEIRTLLKEMPFHPPFETLLEEQLQVTYSQFEQDVANYIYRKYGQ